MTVVCRVSASTRTRPEPNALKFAYAGLPLGALALAAAGFCPQVICLGHTEAPGARRVRRLLGRSALLLARPNLRDSEVMRAILSGRPQVLLSWFWPQRIPAALLARLPHGGYGVHPSLLPRWRGPDPYFWAIYRGDPETGVTVHRLDTEYDTGAIVAQDRVAVDTSENAWQLARRLDGLGLSRLCWVAQQLAHGAPLAETPQEAGAATSAPRPSAEVLAIDWSKPADQIVRLVRAAAPYPGATAALADAEVDIVEAALCPASLPRALAPSEAVSLDGRVVIQSGSGGVVLLKVRTDTGALLRDAHVARLFRRGLSRL
jgi:methionyl-tRNA formyltransferase